MGGTVLRFVHRLGLSESVFAEGNAFSTVMYVASLAVAFFLPRHFFLAGWPETPPQKPDSKSDS